MLNNIISLLYSILFFFFFFFSCEYRCILEIIFPMRKLNSLSLLGLRVNRKPEFGEKKKSHGQGLWLGDGDKMGVGNGQLVCASS